MRFISLRLLPITPMFNFLWQNPTPQLYCRKNPCFLWAAHYQMSRWDHSVLAWVHHPAKWHDRNHWKSNDNILNVYTCFHWWGPWRDRNGNWYLTGFAMKEGIGTLRRSKRGAQNIFTPLNINSFTVIITLEGIEKIKTSNNDSKTVWIKSR